MTFPKSIAGRSTSALGDHNNRVPPGQPAEPQAVLIIRGELLKKYPNTVIFAQHAKMTRDLREPDWLTAGEEKQSAAHRRRAHRSIRRTRPMTSSSSASILPSMK